METKNRSWSGETMISTQKIWQNIKRFWWVFVICLAAYGAITGKDIINTMRADQIALSRDTYQASTLLYFPHRDNEEGLAFVVLCESEMVVNAVNERLEANGYAAYGDGDIFDINWVGNSFGLTLTGEGRERMLCMAQAFGESILKSALDVMEKEGSILNEASVLPCVVRSTGAVTVYEDASQRSVSFSLRDFMTWRRLMVLCAMIFIGVAFVFVAIILDRKVRTREELEAVLTVPCIGVICKKKPESRELTLAVLSRLCRKEETETLAIISAGACGELEDLAREAGKSVKVVTGQQLAKQAAAVPVCEAADRVVLVVCVNQDTIDEVCQAAKTLELLGTRFLGYLLIR